MSRDRLAALRAQAPESHEMGDYRRRYNNAYAQRDDDPYNEPASFEKATKSTTNFAEDMSGFYEEIGSLQDVIKQFTAKVQRIGELHSRSLQAADDSARQRINGELDNLVQETKAESSMIQRRIQALQQKRAPGRDGQIQSQQTKLVTEKFRDAVQEYQRVEREHRKDVKTQMMRQMKIVKPDATPEELNDAAEGNQQIFSQALMKSNRFGQARSAYNAAQERHADIQKIARTMEELAELMAEVAKLVEEQDEQINAIQETAKTVEDDTEKGQIELVHAVKSARAARKKRWICFIITIIILIIVAIVVAVVVLQNQKK